MYFLDELWRLPTMSYLSSRHWKSLRVHEQEEVSS